MLLWLAASVSVTSASPPRHASSSDGRLAQVRVSIASYGRYLNILQSRRWVRSAALMSVRSCQATVEACRCSLPLIAVTSPALNRRRTLQAVADGHPRHASVRRIRDLSWSSKAAVQVSYSGAQPWWCRVWWPLLACQTRAARPSRVSRRTADSGTAALSQPTRLRSNPASNRRQLLQPGAQPGLYVQAYVPYGSSSKTAALPISASLQPSYVATVPNITYPDVTTSNLFNLAGSAMTYFGLRFTGAWLSALLCIVHALRSAACQPSLFVVW